MAIIKAQGLRLERIKASPRFVDGTFKNSHPTTMTRKGTGFGVLFTLPAGAALTGFSHSEQWLRIADESGRNGWVYQDLIGRRP